MLACAVALVLLTDISASVSADRYAVERDGLAAAFESEAIGNLIDQYSPNGGVAVEVVAWSNTRTHTIKWRILHNRIESAQLGSDIRKTIRHTSNYSPTSSFGDYRVDTTALGDAMFEGIHDLQDNAPCAPEKMVIDVSGDGANNDGLHTPNEAKAAAEQIGIQINGLPVTGAEDDIEKYYKQNVRTSDGFVIVSNSAADYPSVIMKKLESEIAQLCSKKSKNT